MSKSFAVCVTDVNPTNISIEKFHLNIWQLSPKEITVDIGLHISIPAVSLFSAKKIRLYLYSPFIVRGYIENLYGVLRDQKNIQLIFNDEVTNITPKNTIPQTDTATLISFKEKGNLLLLKAKINSVPKTDKIEIELDAEGVRQQGLDKKLNCYIRFRYRSPRKGPNIRLTGSGYCDRIFYDIRFNDIRLFPNDDDIKFVGSNRLKIKAFYVFIIQPIENKIISSNENLQYTRFLEKQLFSFYIEDIKKLNTDFMVYYWRTEDSLEDSFTMTAGFEKEKDPQNQILTGILVNIFSGLLLYFPTLLEGSFKINYPETYKHLSYFIYTLGGIILLVGIIIIMSPIISYIKRLINKHKIF